MIFISDIFNQLNFPFCITEINNIINNISFPFMSYDIPIKMRFFTRFLNNIIRFASLINNLNYIKAYIIKYKLQCWLIKYNWNNISSITIINNQNTISFRLIKILSSKNKFSLIIMNDQFLYHLYKFKSWHFLILNFEKFFLHIY